MGAVGVGIVPEVGGHIAHETLYLRLMYDQKDGRDSIIGLKLILEALGSTLLWNSAGKGIMICR